MKKLVLTAVMMMMPFTAFALDAMNDAALDEMTAQEGVTITFDNVVINQTASNMAWIDGDALTDDTGTVIADTAGGSIFIEQDGSTVTTVTGSLTIDVATTSAALTIQDPDGLGAAVESTIDANTTFVKIGLPSVSQAAAAKTMTIGLTPEDGVPTLTAGQSHSISQWGGESLGTLFQDAGSSTITGAVYIYAH
jgi:hypothetical protein